MFAFRVLGGASLEGEDGSLSKKSLQPRRIALLALLAADAHHTLSREKLIAYLWPEGDAEQGRHRLSESLYVLRKDLGEGALISEGDSVRLDPAQLFCDAISFSEAIRNGELEQAVSFYAGPFLDGFHLKNSPEFDRWVESRRLSLAEEFGRALEVLATAANGSSDPLKAVEWWSRVSAHDPYNSRFALGRMEAMARAGDPGNAIHHAREHARFLMEELGTEPTQELLTFAESLRKGEVPIQAVGNLGGVAAEGEGASTFNGDPTSRADGEPGFKVDGEPETREGTGPGPLRHSPTPLPPPAPTPTAGPGRAEAPRGLPGRRSKSRAGGSFVLVTFLILTLLGIGAVHSSLTRSPGPDRISDLVVVPPFENRTGDPELDEIGLLAAMWVEEAIQQVEGVQLVPSSFARQYAEEAATNGSSRVEAVAERSNAGWAVGGTIRALGDSLEFRVEVIDLFQPRKRQDLAQVGSKESLEYVLGRLGRQVAGALAYEFDPMMQEIERGSQPLPSPPMIEAFREHRLGYEAYNRRDWEASFQHHMAAYALDTTLVRALVAAAYMAGMYRDNDHLRDSLAQYSNERRHLLSKQGQLDLDLLLATLAHDREAALRTIRESARLEGGGFNSVLEARFAMSVNRPGEALEALDRYDPNVEWRRGEAHAYWVNRTGALHMLGEFQEELVSAHRGRDTYPSHLELLISEVRGLAALGRVEEVSGLLHRARALSNTNYTAALVAGPELRAHGYPDASMDVFNRAAEWLMAGRSAEELDSTERASLAEALYGAERWAEAHEVSASLLAESPEDLSALGMVGLTGARLGDSVLASGVIDRLSRMSRRDAPWEHLYLMASISAVLNEPEEAMRMLYQAIGEGFPHGLRLHRDMNFESLREREDFRALLAPKG